MRLPNADACLAHQGDFAFRFKLNHGEQVRLGLTRGSVSFAPSAPVPIQ
jgi:hypothetical protein